VVRIIVQRLLSTIPVLLIVSGVVFSLMHLIPGDPAIFMLREQATPQRIQELHHQLGLDKPLPVQYVDWLAGVLRGDLGRSLITNQPVAWTIGNALLPTAQLALFSLVIALIIGLSAGIASAIRPRSPADTLGSILSLLGICMPTFWTGIVFILVFAVILKILPPSGYVPFYEDPVENLRKMALPSLCIGWLVGAVLMRQTRSSFKEVLQQDYVRVAWAKGLHERTITLRHALKNALIPVLTVAGLEVGTLFGGAVVTETIFAIPGLGQAMVQAIFSRDFPVVQGLILVMVVAVVIANLVVDVLYVVLDPRIRHA
jgi:peptide/nickel transport system permease protein